VVVRARGVADFFATTVFDAAGFFDAAGILATAGFFAAGELFDVAALLATGWAAGGGGWRFFVAGAAAAGGTASCGSAGGSGRSGAIVRGAAGPPRVAATARQFSPRKRARSARRRLVRPGSSTSAPFLLALFQRRNWSAAPL